MKKINLYTKCTQPGLVLVVAILLAFTAKVNAQTIDIGPNQYAFQFTQNPNYGLFFNSSALQYEFRNGSAAPIFAFDASNGLMKSNLQFASSSDFLVGPNRYAFRSSVAPNIGLYSTNNRIQFLNSAASPIFSINVADGRFDTDLEFMNNKTYKVAPGKFAIRSAVNANAGLYFGSAEYEFRNLSGGSALRINVSSGDIQTDGTVTASGGNSAQWNQAHAWGDHATAGYLNVESDPKIANDLAVSEVPRWNGSQLAASAITATGSEARITGTPSSFTTTGAPAGNLLVLENPGAPPFGANTSESSLAFSKDGTITGRLATTANHMLFESTNDGNIALRAGGSDHMTLLPNGNVGIGLTNPEHRLHVNGVIRATSGSYAIRGTKTGSGTFPGVWGETESSSNEASGVRGHVNNESPGNWSAGVYGHNFGTGIHGTGVRGIHDGGGYGVYGESKSGIGVYGRSLAESTSSTAYGVYGRADGSGGTRVGVLGVATGGTTNWASYFLGNEYVSGDLRVGTLTGANGYKLSVNGKAICTEMRVQLQSNWPDYVFDESYEKLSLNDLEDFITHNKHLPNIPSAAEIETQGGVDLGEMQRLTIEKLEELSLYIIELKKNNDVLSARSDALSAENERLLTRIEALEK